MADEPGDEPPATPGAGTVMWDIEQGEVDTAGLEDLDGVVHLAGEGIGEKRWTDEQKRKILESRTKGTSLLASALASLDAKPPVLVSGAAVGVYGDRGDEQLTEASAPGTGFLADVVIAWEAAAQPAEAAGIRVPGSAAGSCSTPTAGCSNDSPACAASGSSASSAPASSG